MTKQPIDKPSVFLGQLSWPDRILYSLGVGLGSGLVPKAPGTMGSLLILLLMPLWIAIGFFASLMTVVAMCLLGIWICDRTAHIMQVHDDSRIVFDEFAGQSIVLLPLLALEQTSLLAVLAAFGLFRLFDVIKPWPIGAADRRVHGGLGIMLDDILAGLMAAGLLYAALWLGMNYFGT